MNFLKVAQTFQPLAVLLTSGARKLFASYMPVQLWYRDVRRLPQSLSALSTEARKKKSSGTGSSWTAWLTCTLSLWFQNNSPREGRRWKEEDGAINQSFGLPYRDFLCVSILTSVFAYFSGLIPVIQPLLSAYYVLNTSLRILHVLSCLIPFIDFSIST